MNFRALLVGTLTALSVAGAWGVYVQNQRLTNLRAERARLSDLAPAASNGDLSGAATIGGPEDSAAAQVEAASRAELLRLRNQVSQLTGRKRELAPALAENERLKTQLAARGTNASAAASFPAGYIRKSEAQWTGLKTPEDTVRSFLWALRNHDLTNVLQTLTPAAGQEILRAFANNPEQFYKASDSMPGMRVLYQQELSSGSIDAQIEIVPGQTQLVHFSLSNGQYRMDMH